MDDFRDRAATNPTAEIESVQDGSPEHTAVVFFHGMGKQRHYESIATLVEMLEHYVHLREPGLARSNWKTKLRREKVDCDDPDNTCASIEVNFRGSRVRFYEAYWAPAAVEGTTAASVFWWLMAQISRPYIMLRSKWRSFSRIRRADLIRMGQDEQSEDYKELCARYGGFCEGKGNTEGSWREFRAFVKMDTQPGEERDRLLQLADRWRKTNRGNDWKRLAVLVTIGFSVASAAGLLVFAATLALGYAAQFVPLLPANIKEAVEPSIKPTVSNAASMVMVLVGLLGGGRFLKDSVGDVQQFVTYEEAEPLHERRQKIIGAAETTLKHVLASPGCKRVVVVGHSLGTAVALDTILRLHGVNDAGETSAKAKGESFKPVPLDLIEYFITSGSPIDKINYFFATLRSDNATFETMVDRLRGDISSPPFSKTGRQPRLHWINFWDLGDVISGEIDTVSAQIVRKQRVDNVRIASYLLPDPTAAHAAYFTHPKYAGTLFDCAFCDALSFVTPPRDADNRPVWPWVGPGSGRAVQTALAYTLALVPVTLGWSVAAAAGYASRPWAFGSMTAVLAGTVALPWLLHNFRPRKRLSNVQPALSEEVPVGAKAKP